MVRSSLIFITALKGIQVAPCILSVNRSIRTAKIATIREICKQSKSKKYEVKRRSETKKGANNPWKGDYDSSSLNSADIVSHQDFFQRLTSVRDL